MLFRATVVASIRVAAASSPITQEFPSKNGFEEEEKENNMESFVHKSKGFLPINLPNPKVESFDTEGIEGEGKRSKVAGLKEKLAGDVSQGITLGFFNSSNRARVLACSSCW